MKIIENIPFRMRGEPVLICSDSEKGDIDGPQMKNMKTRNMKNIVKAGDCGDLLNTVNLRS